MPNNTITFYQELSDSTGKSVSRLMAEYDDVKIGKGEFWGKVSQYGEDEGLAPIKVDLVGDKEGDLLTELARSIGDCIMFPKSTIYLHALGVVASAMTRSFRYQYRNEALPVNLYVVTAQPPSTGKSGCNNYLSKPVQIAYSELNKVNKVKRAFAVRQVEDIEKKLKVKDLDENQFTELMDMLDDAQMRVDKNPIYKYALDDTTIEGAERVAACQDGMFNIVSAEAESINVVVGSVYGDASKKANFGLLLKAWDGEYTSISRSGRDGYEGHLRASIAVIAQYDSVDSLLSSGATGRGLAERFLMLAEDNYLGKRNHLLPRGSVSSALMSNYSHLISSIVGSEGVTLTVCELSQKAINICRNKFEPMIANGGDYSSNMVTGFVGKADKQIIKIASVIHVSRNWCLGGEMKTEIELSAITKAIRIFEKLTDAYVNAADIMGHSGSTSEMHKIIERFSELVRKRQTKILIPMFVNNIKNVKPFSGSRSLTSRLKETLLPSLEKMNYCVVSNNTIYINPNL